MRCFALAGALAGTFVVCAAQAGVSSPGASPFTHENRREAQTPATGHINEWAAKFHPGSVSYSEQADDLARKYGLVNLGQVCSVLLFQEDKTYDVLF